MKLGSKGVDTSKVPFNQSNLVRQKGILALRHSACCYQRLLVGNL